MYPARSRASERSGASLLCRNEFASPRLNPGSARSYFSMPHWRHRKPGFRQLRRLLCSNSEWPCGCRATNNSEKLPSPHACTKGSGGRILSDQTGPLIVARCDFWAWRRALGRCPLWVCAVQRRCFPVGANPTRQTLQPEATGAAMEVTKWLKPSDSASRIGDGASVRRNVSERRASLENTMRRTSDPIAPNR